MSIGLTSRPEPAPIPETPLWTLTKNGRTAEARVRMFRDLPELRCYVDGELVWSQVVRERSTIDDLSNDRCDAFLARGWQSGRL